MPSLEKTCFHCGLPVPKGLEIQVDINDEPQPMCCHGCAAVSQAIIDGGFSSFYQHRTQDSNTGKDVVPEFLQQLTTYDLPEVQKQFVIEQSEHHLEASLIIEGIVCAACVWMSEKHIAQLPGVMSVSINYTSRRAQVMWDEREIKLSDIIAAISNIGYMAHPYDASKWQNLIEKERKTQLKRLGVAGLFGMQVMMLAVALYAGDFEGMEDRFRVFFYWVSLGLTLPILVYSAKPFFLSAWRDLKQKQLGMDVPVSIGIFVAFFASVWTTLTQQGHVYYDSVAMFVFFLLTGRYFELIARKRVVEATESLATDMPMTANRLLVDGGVESVAVAELILGDVVLVKAGESIPADGKIVQGDTAVDESLLTGESKPVTKKMGQLVVGGSLNVTSPIEVLVEKTGADTTLSHIQRMLERAQSEKPQITQLADLVASWFVFAVIVIALSVAWYWWSVPGADWLSITVSVLIVTCPCALSLATPTAMTAATGTLTLSGLLVARGRALEALNKVTHIVFDKTGTLTTGRLSITQVQLESSHDEAFCLALAAGLESRSEHSLAKPFQAITDPVSVEGIENIPGQGLQGSYQGQVVAIGTQQFVQGVLKIDSAPQFSGKTGSPLYLGWAGEWLAIITLQDEVREGAQNLVASLSGKQLSILSGDHAVAVDALAEIVGIDESLSRQTPESKLAYVQQLQAQGAIVAMVGDGINDAPVLAAADVSIAMGSGTELAQTSADIVLLSEKLDVLSFGFSVAIKTVQIIKQNLWWALGYNLLALPLAAAGFIEPWMAAIGMSLSSIIVVLNALRLGRLKVSQ